jgi:uncharacterized protein (DUF2252 family)
MHLIKIWPQILALKMHTSVKWRLMKQQERSPRDVIARIRFFHKDQDPTLVKRKYQALRANVFAFFRGTSFLFYEDWPVASPLDQAPLVWVCGDLHLENFGGYKSDDRKIYFDLNDFDEATLAPSTWELARMLTSVLVGGEVLKIKRAEALAQCHLFLNAYSQALIQGKAHILGQDEASGPIKRLLSELAQRKRKDFLKERTVLKDGKRVLRIDQVKMLSVSGPERERVISAFHAWSATQPNPPFFRVLDLGQRIAGIASLGLKRYALLVEGKGSPDQNYLLELKQARSSTLQLHLAIPQPTWMSEAERIVAVQQRMQAMPPALLHALSLEKDSFVLKELQPSQDRIALQSLTGDLDRLDVLMQTMGRLTAWAQLRSSNQQGSVSKAELFTFVKAQQGQHALLEYAQTYARQTEKDYQTFCKALDRGEL